MLNRSPAFMQPILIAAAMLAVTFSTAAFAQQIQLPPNAAEIGAAANAATDMEPKTNINIVKAAVAQIPETIPAGPFQPAWDSLKQNYKVPEWFVDAKFGIFMHWGLYSVPAFGGGSAAEWYETHLYSGGATLNYHVGKYGTLDQFGYKDFIPLFKAEKYDPEAQRCCLKNRGQSM